MKRWLYVFMFLALLLGGCTDVDMSGFGHIGFTMQNPAAPRPATSSPDARPATQLAHTPNQLPCPTP